MNPEFSVVVSRGSLATGSSSSFTWADGVTTVEAPFTGLHVTHLAVAGCVLNDTYREAGQLGLRVDGVRVSVRGAFDMGGASFGPVEYLCEVDSPEDPSTMETLKHQVEQIAEIPRALAQSVTVTRIEG